ncbi:MAG: hypothetical protein KGL39_15215 [Patescibacteria group bacterium]|nr:hypothetical protein [Patescibacteria group bacterium]
MTTYTWVPTGHKVLIPCVNCGGEYEHLRVEPDRSPAYMRELYLCRNCKGIFGFSKQPELRVVR